MCAIFLWGTVAVVAAIVKSGLRIMPHSGGRVGRGIYLASENAKRSVAGCRGVCDRPDRVRFLNAGSMGKNQWRMCD